MEKFIKETIFNKSKYDVDKFELYRCLVENMKLLSEVTPVPLKYGKKELEKVICNFVAKNDYRKVIEGVYYDNNGYCVATNGKYMAYFENEDLKKLEKSFIQGKEGKIEGQYPIWQNIIPKTFVNEFIVKDVAYLAGKVKAIRNLMNFAINKSEACYIQLEEINEIIDSNFLLTILKSYVDIGEKEIKIEYNNDRYPFKISGSKGFNVVTMSAMIKEGDVKIKLNQ